jgi:hypothetical protein
LASKRSDLQQRMNISFWFSTSNRILIEESLVFIHQKDCWFSNRSSSWFNLTTLTPQYLITMHGPSCLFQIRSEISMLIDQTWKLYLSIDKLI